MYLSLVAHNKLTFPSGSALERYDGSYYLFGDDSPYFAILNKTYDIKQRIILTYDYAERIPKPFKPDWEACTTINDNIWVFGSGSNGVIRDNILIINPVSCSFVIKEKHSIYHRLRTLAFSKEINIEAATMVEEELWLFNRAHHSQPNHLIKCTVIGDEIDIIEIQEIPSITYHGHILGISGAAYDKELHILWLTASAESTENSYDDGEILGSVIFKSFCINGVFDILEAERWELTNIDPKLNQQKIESICVSDNSPNNYHLVIIADNDIGDTEIFELKVSFQE